MSAPASRSGGTAPRMPASNRDAGGGDESGGRDDRHEDTEEAEPAERAGSKGQGRASLSPPGGSCGRRRVSGRGDRWSTIRPSARNNTLSAWAAATGSCVTITMVSTWLSTHSRSRLRISAPVRESRAPVGSSAKTTSGLMTRARAMATRCCWPPDSCAGRWLQQRRPDRHVRPLRPASPVGTVAGQPSREPDVLLDGECRQAGCRPGRRSRPGPAAAASACFSDSCERSVLPIRTSPDVGAVEPGREVQQRALARARRTHDRGERRRGGRPPSRCAARARHCSHAPYVLETATT